MMSRTKVRIDGNGRVRFEGRPKIKKHGCIAFFGALMFFLAPAAADTKNDCHIGSYRLSDGTNCRHSARGRRHTALADVHR